VDRRGWVAVTASTLGVALIALGTPAGGSSGGGATLMGDGLVLLSLLATVTWVILGKHLLRTYPPMFVSGGVLWIGTAMLLPYVLLTAGLPPLQLSLTTWLALLVSGLLATSTTIVLWNWGLAHVPASHAGVFANLEPVIGAILGIAVLGERLGGLALTGGVLIIGAAVIMTTAPASSG
jgi:drug/metabolite transporter (DMT)-like permease